MLSRSSARSFREIVTLAAVPLLLISTTATARIADMEDAQASGAEKSSDEEVVQREVRPSGLIIEDLELGDGPAVEEESAITVRCVGRLKDGSVFFDSDESGGPMTFTLDQVIPGWRQGIPGMKVGGVRRLTIPPDLAYGAQGRPPQIPGNSTLTFRIELEDFVTVDVKTLRAGEGEPAGPDAVLEIRFKGMLADGTVFQETEEGSTASVPLGGQLIPGWKIGLQGIREGEVRRLEVPHPLAFGDRGIPDKVPPRTDVVFEIECVNIPRVEIEVLSEGEGKPCPRGATVTIEYTGTLEDGTIFDSTKGRGAATFDLDGLISGWQQGIPGMKPGEVRKLTVPYQLGYGEQGRDQIPPKATLIFEIEMVRWRK